MSEDTEIAGIARRAADRLENDIDKGLRQDVEHELAKDPLEQRPERVFEPVSFAALIVSLASFGWTVYRDLKKDREAAKAGRSATEARLAVLLREEDHLAAGRLPPDMTAEQQSLVIATIAAEIVATDPPSARLAY
jgi:hypothetical protein